MTEYIDPHKAGERAANYFGDGYHCAEAVVAAFFEAIGDDAADAIAYATAFGGGFGKTFAETCGVLSGSMIAIGHICGRRQRGDSWDKPAEFGAAIMLQFIKNNGTSNCGVLRERFGEEEQMTECRKLVREGSIALVTMYQDRKSYFHPQETTDTL